MTESVAPERLATVSTKLPAGLQQEFAALAKRRGVTASALLRRLVEHELAGAPDGDAAGEVESSVRGELEAAGIELDMARPAAALNLARRMDRSPTAGAANAQQLRALLTELVPVSRDGVFDPLMMLRLQAKLKRRGFHVVDKDGRPFSTSSDWCPELESVML